MNPGGLAYDPVNSRLFVSDASSYNRVLVYNVTTIVDGQNAAYVLGEPDFTSVNYGSPPTQSNMYFPVGLAYDSAGSRLFVADSNGVRVLEFNVAVASITNGENADHVLGASDFIGDGTGLTQSGVVDPVGLAYDAVNSRLFVSDSNNANRVLVYNVISSTDGQNAAYELGQADFYSDVSSTSQTGLNGPVAVAYDSISSQLFIGDSVNRVVVQNVSSISNGQNASSVLGEFNELSQPLYGKSGQDNGPNPSGFQFPNGVAIDTATHRMFVSDSYNNRVLVFGMDSNDHLTSHIASYVLGQSDFDSGGATTTQAGMSVPYGLAYDAAGARLFVSDSGNNRVLVYNVASITNGQNAAHVLGQSDFVSNGSTTSQSGMNVPFGLAYDTATARLFVVDQSNTRVLVYNVASISDGQNAAHVLGQPDFTSINSTAPASYISYPFGVAYDAGNSRLFVADIRGERVLVFNVASITDGQDAVNVLGQPNFNATAFTYSQNGMAQPEGVAYDPANSRLFVTNTDPGNIFIYNVSSITNGQNAAFVLGQPTFGSRSSFFPSQSAMSTSILLAYDPSNSNLWAVDSNRLMAFNASVQIPNNILITAASTGTFTVTYSTAAGSQGFELDASTASDFAGTLFSSITTNGSLGTLITPTLSADTLYYLRLGNILSGTTYYGFTVPPSSSTWTNLVQGGQVYAMYQTSAVVNWQSLAGQGGSQGYELDVANDPDFTNIMASSVTASVNVTTLTIPSGLSPGTPYYFRIGGINQNGAVRYSVIGSSATTSSGSPGPGLTDGTSAADMVGELNESDLPYYTKGGADNSPNNRGLSGPRAVVIDTVTHRMFVADEGNNRVLVYNLDSSDNLISHFPNNVLGQPDLDSNNASLTAAGMENPVALAYDAINSRLFVSDNRNQRVLVYNVASISNGQNAVHVLGQANFVSKVRAATPNGFYFPGGLAYDAVNNRLFVVDTVNNRVLVFNVASITDGQNAAHVLGQSDFYSSGNATTQNTLNRAFDVAYDASNSRLFVMDSGNFRVLVFDASSITDGQNAIHVLGEPDFFTSANNTTQNGLGYADCLGYDSANSRLFVSDTSNSRVLIFNVASITDGQLAAHVLGQPDFMTSGAGFPNQNDFSSPAGLGYDPLSSRLYIADSSWSRIVVQNVTSITDNQNASDVLGQLDDSDAVDYTKTGSNDSPNIRGFDTGYGVGEGVAIDTATHRMFVADRNNNRVVVFNLDSSDHISSRIESKVLGQTDFSSNGSTTSQNGMSGPTRVAYDPGGSRLFVSDTGNDRVLVFNVASITNGQNAVHVLGEPDYVTATATATLTGVSAPAGLAYDAAGARLFVADSGNNRVLVYNVASITDGQNAAHVLGQSGFVSSGLATTQNGMDVPFDVAYDTAGARLFVADSSNNRVLIYNVASITDGQNAAEVLGQVNFTAAASDTSQVGMAGPSGVAYAPADSRLFVADTSNSRVLVFSAASVTNGQSALYELGQPNFFTSSGGNNGPTVNTFNSPTGLVFDPPSSTLFIGDSGNNRVMTFADAGVGCSTITSITNGGWSSSLTWDKNVVPTSCNPVVIAAGTTVTVDGDDTASTTTINGDLYFSRVVNSTVTLVGGNMNVNAGGTLDMGTASSPINASSATLILSSGAYAGQYGLIVNNGGNFLVYGAAKAPWAPATSTASGTNVPVVTTGLGWSVGDTVTVDTEAVTITVISGSALTVSPALALTHTVSSANPLVVVADLSRNVLIRSSGTVVGAGGNSAYVESLVTNATSFNLNYGEFAYLGETTGIAGKPGLALWGASTTGSISSSTVRYGSYGLYLNNSSQVKIIGNNIYSATNPGIWFESATHNFVFGNNIFANASYGIRFNNSSFYNLIQQNNFFNNGNGLFPDAYCTIYNNRIYNNSGDNVSIPVSQDLYGSDVIYGGSAGLNLVGTPNTFISETIYGNSYLDLRANNASTDTFVGCNIAYTTAAVASGNGIGEGPFQLVFKSSLLNPSSSVRAASFSQTGVYLVNYSTQAGNVQVYGDYQVSGSTMTLDYAQMLYASTATTPQALLGTSISAISVTGTSDNNAVSQIVFITYDGSNWNVTGSSTGAMGQYTAGSGNPQNLPSGTPQFTLVMTYASPAAGDTAAFGLLAGSKDQNVQTTLSFGSADPSYNNGRSKIEITSGAGFHAVGQSATANPTLIDMMAGGGTYYTFVDSGAFTIQYASMMNMDENGVELNGTGPFSINDSTFDYSGNGVISTSTLFSLNGVTHSTITLTDVTYGNSRANGNNYNYNIIGSSTGLQWTHQSYSGTLTGAANTEDDQTQQHIIWPPENVCQTFNSQATGLWSSSSTWDSGFIPTACNTVNVVVGTTVTLDIPTAVASTTTISGQLSFSRVASSTLTIVGGNVNVNAGGTLDMGTTASPINASSATLILAYGQTAGQYGLIVQNGGNFLVYGAAKTPWTTVTGAGTIGTGITSFSVANATGWQVGDLISIDTEAVTIAAGGISGNTISNYSPGLGLVHYATSSIVVANLTRNVVVQSSGTTSSSNTAYVQNLATNATSFNVNYGAFSYLGTSAAGTSKYGITFDGAGVQGSISSSTLQNAYDGINLNTASSNTFTANVIAGYQSIGINGSHTVGNTLALNYFYSSGFTTGIQMDSSSSRNRIMSNRILSPYIGAYLLSHNDLISNNYMVGGSLFGGSYAYGIWLNGSGNTVQGNNFYSNAQGLLVTTGSNNLFVGNQAYSNNYGFYFLNSGNNNTSVANYSYSNNPGILVSDAQGEVWVEGGVGYSSAGVLSPNTVADISATPSSLPAQITVLKARVGTSGITVGGSAIPGALCFLTINPLRPARCGSTGSTSSPAVQ